ncbi:PREDICTED: TP53-target gene 5 protein [Condylura cristata]|uniref:TP53-target gene 5 protein n=1 Tax=Condylura cristata TaxID=143302 RepID=UPI0003347B6E|nr:PREDICTED: TP53-target gene 5 protein [Condylura cristata]
MSPSVKKRPESRVISKKYDKESQDIIQKPVSTEIERNRLKMVIKNLSLLRVLKSSNPRIQEMHTLAKRCWDSLIRVPRTLCVSPRNDVCKKGKLHNAGLPGATYPKNKLQCKGEPGESEPEGWKPRRRLGERTKGSPSRERLPEEQAEPAHPRTWSQDSGPGARGGRPPLGNPRVVFLKPLRHRAPKWGAKQPEEAGQWMWFEGLPTRVHLPGPRVMCRSSARRWVKRCCTRFCSASLELPRHPPYRV